MELLENRDNKKAARDELAALSDQPWGQIMKMIQLSTRQKQALMATIFVTAITLTFFATKAWAMDSKPRKSPPRVPPSSYDNYVRAKPATTTTTTTTTTTPSKPLITIPTPTTTPLVSQPSESIWDTLAACESGGRWDYNGSSGFDGGLQFSPSTWTRLHTHWGANTGYEFAWQAPREIQIQVAILNMQVSSGTHSQWPVCSRKIGMPNKF